MGDVAMWTGLVTGSMMFVSPYLFKLLGWKGVAKATPNFLCWTGVPFFLGCIAYAMLHSSPVAPLRLLVAVGAILQVRHGSQAVQLAADPWVPLTTSAGADIWQRRKVLIVQACGRDGLHWPRRGEPHQGKGCH